MGGVDERGYRRASCNHGLLARSSSDSDLAVVAGGYPGSLDVEAYEEEEEEEDDDDDDDDSGDDGDDDDDCMGGAERGILEQLPYPGFVPLSMKYLDQKSRPRNWCLAMITNPYPFHGNRKNFFFFFFSFTVIGRRFVMRLSKVI